MSDSHVLVDLCSTPDRVIPHFATTCTQKKISISLHNRGNKDSRDAQLQPARTYSRDDFSASSFSGFPSHRYADETRSLSKQTQHAHVEKTKKAGEKSFFPRSLLHSHALLPLSHCRTSFNRLRRH